MTNESDQTLFNPNKLPFDPTKVTHMIALLAVMAGVLWALALTWLFLASSTSERVIAGLIAGLLFIGILVAIVALSRLSPKAIGDTVTTTPDAASDLAKGVVRSPGLSEARLKQKGDRALVGKDADYMITDPRPAWSVRWTSLAGILVEDTSIVDEDFISIIERRLPGVDVRSNDVLNVRSNMHYEIDLDLSVSKINGLPALYMHHAPVRTQLIIIPWRKYCSLRGHNDTLLSFAIERLAGTLGQGSIKEFRAVLRDDGWPAVIAESEEVLEGVIVNGVEHQNLRIRTTIVCRESPTKYYALIWTYPEGNSVELADVDRLRQVVDSFRLVSPVDPKAETKRALLNAQQSRENWIHANAEEISRNAFVMLINKVASLDLKKQEDLQSAMHEIGRFFQLVDLVGAKVDQLFLDLRNAWEEAERGNIDNLVDEVQEAVDAIIRQDDS